MAAFFSLFVQWGETRVMEVASRVVIECVVVCVQAEGRGRARPSSVPIPKKLALLSAY